MAGMNSYDSRFHQRVVQKLLENYDSKGQQLLNGNIRGDMSDFAATAQKYSEQVGWLKCLKFVERVCQDVADELAGREKK
jgi:hypothetical protein